MNSNYEYLATRRKESMFLDDIRENYKVLKNRLVNSRIAILGAAGSIGSSVVKNILAFNPRSVTLIDINENNLVEVVRDLRSSCNISVPQDFSALPIAFGSIEMKRYFIETKPFNYILNLSAIKHVRSEKNIYSLIRMVDTNILYLYEFLEFLPYKCEKVFSVSTDKATNPSNLMGASKLIMENILFLYSHNLPTSTARFANVAFSDGSLPYGFLKRIEKKQPIAAPVDVKRFFITHEEAGQLCLLSCVSGENRDVFFPKLQKDLHELTFSEIAVRLLEHLGYEPYECSSEVEAKKKSSELIRNKKWPCFFFKSDTTGEKEYEEFFEDSDELDLNRYKNIGIIKKDKKTVDEIKIKNFIEFAYKAKMNNSITKNDYVREFKKIVPKLTHIEKGRNLDQKM